MLTRVVAALTHSYGRAVQGHARACGVAVDPTARRSGIIESDAVRVGRKPQSFRHRIVTGVMRDLVVVVGEFVLQLDEGLGLRGTFSMTSLPSPAAC